MQKLSFALPILFVLAACGSRKAKSDDAHASASSATTIAAASPGPGGSPIDPKPGTRGTCAAYETDGKTVILAETAPGFDYRDCRARLQARLSPVVCARGGGKQPYMHQIGDGRPATDTIDCGGAAKAAAVTPPPPTPAPTPDLREGGQGPHGPVGTGKGTCSAADASGKVLAVEPAPDFDYRKCRTRLQARLVPMLCKGPGKQPYMHKISDGKLAADTIACPA